jgi:hypothetical protein
VRFNRFLESFLARFRTSQPGLQLEPLGAIQPHPHRWGPIKDHARMPPAGTAIPQRS